jgi:triosephosphate isomerase (TIM)
LTRPAPSRRALTASLAAARVAIFPPATLLHRLVEAVEGSFVLVGGQDCHPKASGAHTGDVSAEMIADAGATLVICGHSERRTDHAETSPQVAAKAEAALAAGLEPIICVGETLALRQAGEAVPFVLNQIRESLPASLSGKAFNVAYEPLWAIGTGHTASVDNIVEMHAAIRAELVVLFGEQGQVVPILYGGSVKPENAHEILSAPDVGGALVGGASLKAKDFLAIVEAA